MTQYSYDQDRRLTGVSAGGVLQSTITYDATGRQTEVETPDARVAIEYEQVLQERHVARPATISRFTPAAALNPESTLSLGYDGPMPLASAAGGETEGAVAFEIDEQLRPTVIRVADEPDIVLAYNDDSDLVYAGGLQIFPAIHARRAETRLGVGAVVLTTGTNLTELGDIELREALCPNCWSTELLRIAYAPDAAGRITTALESVAGAGLAPTSLTRTFEYDALGRLTSERRGAVESTWTYDENGNRTSANGVPAVYDAQDRLVSFGDVTYEHDPLGRRTARVDGEDRTEYGYDSFGALQSVELPEGPSVQYVHDPMGRRIARYEDGVRTAGWLYLDSLRPVAELNAANEVTSVFIYGGDGHAPSVMRRGGETYRFITDHLGSVRVVVRMSDGEVVERTDYDAWGQIVATPVQTPGFSQPFGFAGGLHDRVTGLVHFGAREYDPATGRWMQKDPIRFAGGDTNIYAYVGGDPVGRVDPTGLETIIIIYDGDASVADIQHAAIGVVRDDVTHFFDPGGSNPIYHDDKQRFTKSNGGFISRYLDFARLKGDGGGYVFTFETTPGEEAHIIAEMRALDENPLCFSGTCAVCTGAAASILDPGYFLGGFPFTLKRQLWDTVERWREAGRGAHSQGFELNGH